MCVKAVERLVFKAGGSNMDVQLGPSDVFAKFENYRKTSIAFL